MIIALISKVCHELLYCNFKLQENGRAKALQPKCDGFILLPQEFCTTNLKKSRQKHVCTATPLSTLIL